MKLRTKCPNCGQEYLVDSSVIGLTLRCRHCDKDFTAAKICPEPSKPNSSGFYNGIDSSPKATSSTRPNFVFNQQTSTVSSLKKNKKPKKQVNNGSDNSALNWIGDFFNFKVMITPSLIRLEFLLLFIGGSVSALVYPFQTENRSIMWQILMCVAFVFVGIPLWAVVLHTFYELAMIPFVILETLLEISNKLDEKNKELNATKD